MMSHQVKVAAHMSTIGGNIPGNSMQAFEAALRFGADIIELDASMSSEGTLFVFHPGTEKVKLREDCRVDQLTDAEIRAKRLVNVQGTKTEMGIPTLREALEVLRGRCLVDIDKFPDHPKEIAQLVREMGMQDQVILMIYEEKDLYKAEEYAWDLPVYVRMPKEIEKAEALVKNPRLRYVGSEVLFDTDEDPQASDSRIQWMHDHGIKAWANAIVFDYKRQLAAGHSDDVSILDDPEKGWGWLAKKKFDIIQTDWPFQLSNYLRSIGAKK